MYMHSSRSNFNMQMSELESSLLDLASMVEKAVNYAVTALKNRDHRLAQRVITSDRTLNSRRYEIENEALSLLALQQPVVSRDLRYIAAVMHIAGELERMGDYAKGIARISDMIAGTPPVQVVIHLQQMAEQSNTMLHKAMDAFIARDALAAHQVAVLDDGLDDLYNVVYRELLALMFADNSMVDQATLLLWAAHNVERVGDRVTNICERIQFVETGVMGDSPGQHDTE